MTQEEKAKAYDEVLNKAKIEINTKGIGETVDLCYQLFPQLGESGDENLKNKSGYYKAGKFWKASTLWNATKNKVPQRVSNRYILQECTWNIGTLQRFADEVKNVQEVSLDYPIILDMNGNIIDGAHRVVKAYLEGKDIDVIYLGDDEWPEPDYDEEKAVKESEDERIRKEIYNFFKNFKETGTWKSISNVNTWIAYLEKQKEPDNKEGDFTIYHPLKNAKGEYECIPYSFYGSLTSFSEDKDLIDFLRTCFYTEEECNEWIKQQNEQKPLTNEEKEYIRTIKSIISDFIRDKKPENLAYYQRIYDWLDGRYIPFSCGHENGKPTEWAELRSEFDINEAVENGKKEVIDHPDKYGLTKQKPFSKQEYESHPIASEDTTSVKPVEFDGKTLLYTADKSYQIGFRDGVASVKPVEWSEEDERKRNGLVKGLEDRMGFGWASDPFSREDYIAWLKSLPEKFVLQPKQEWDVEDKLMIKCCLEAINVYKHKAKRGKFLPARFNIGGYLASLEKVESWLKSLRLTKQEWSEEDEQLLGFVYDLLADSLWNSKYAMSKDECLDRLTSLRQRLQP